MKRKEVNSNHTRLNFQKAVCLSEVENNKLDEFIKVTGFNNFGEFIRHCIACDFLIKENKKSDPKQLEGIYNMLLEFRNNFNYLATLIDKDDQELTTQLKALVNDFNQMLAKI